FKSFRFFVVIHNLELETLNLEQSFNSQKSNVLFKTQNLVFYCVSILSIFAVSMLNVISEVREISKILRFANATLRMTKRNLNEIIYDTEFIDAWEFVLWMFGLHNNMHN